LLASHGWKVTAVDCSEVALRLIREQGSKIETVLADLEAGEFAIEPDAWDLICVTLYLQRDLFSSIRVGLKQGGYVAAAFPLRDEREGVKPMNHDYLLEPGELASLFEGFEFIHYAETNPEPPRRRMAELFARRTT
jgi:SAM-dependent methyltransferase